MINHEARARALTAKERNNAKTLDHYHRTRSQALIIYGGECAWCGGTRGLQFDHVNADGGAHRQRETHGSLYRRIVASGVRLTDVELQLLCGPCHSTKSVLEAARRALLTRDVSVERVRKIFREISR